MPPLLEELVETFAAVAEQKDKTIRRQPIVDLPPVFGDRMLRQILVKLIPNALTHAHRGERN